MQVKSKLITLLPNLFILLLKELRFRLIGFKEYDMLDQAHEAAASDWFKVAIDLSELDCDQEPGLKVLFITGYGLGSHYLALEPILINALLVRGAQVSSFYCGKSLPACEFNPIGNNYPSAQFEDLRGVSQAANCFACNRCSRNLEEVYSNFSISMSRYSDFIDPSCYDELWVLSGKVDFGSLRHWTYKGVAIGEEVYATILRVSFMGSIPDNLYFRNLARRLVYSGLLMFHATFNRFVSERPDRVVLIHGIYLTHGIPVKVANKLGIPVVVVGGGGIRKDTAIFCHGETYHHQLINESNSLWENLTVSAEQEKRILQYASGKKNIGASQDYLSYHPNPLEDIDVIRKQLNVPRDKKVLSIFTNVIWDAQILYKSNAFDDIFDWIYFTIDQIGKNSDILGIIRIHPAEAKGGNPTKQPMLPEIMRHYGKGLPENIRIIPPESDVSSYKIAELSSHAVIYGTKMGLELALMRVPVVICGETFSRNKGYGLDIYSKAQYQQFISDPNTYTPDLDKIYQRALRYAHYFYFQRMIDMPFTSGAAGEGGKGPRLDFTDIKDLGEGLSKELDTICDGIINQNGFQLFD